MVSLLQGTFGSSVGKPNGGKLNKMISDIVRCYKNNERRDKTSAAFRIDGPASSHSSSGTTTSTAHAIGTNYSATPDSASSDRESKTVSCCKDVDREQKKTAKEIDDGVAVAASIHRV